MSKVKTIEATEPVVDISSLSADQMKVLMKQLEEKQKLEQKQISEKRSQYKGNVHTQVSELFPMLQKTSATLTEVKKEVFSRLQGLIVEKAVVYDREEDQTSHSFTTKEGDITIIIGYNMIDGWDDTANTGMAKVHDYLKSLGKNKDSRMLVDGINKLLSKDSKGNLKASRVLQLKQMAEKSGSQAFIDAIQIITDAYRPVRSKEYVRCIYKEPTGESVTLPLSITDAPLPPVKEAEA
jgi:hypothetical protein